MKESVDNDGTKCWTNVKANFPVTETSPDLSSDGSVAGVGLMHMLKVRLIDSQVCSALLTLEVNRFAQVVREENGDARDEAKQRDF